MSMASSYTDIVSDEFVLLKEVHGSIGPLRQADVYVFLTSPLTNMLMKVNGDEELIRHKCESILSRVVSYQRRMTWLLDDFGRDDDNFIGS